MLWLGVACLVAAVRADYQIGKLTAGGADFVVESPGYPAEMQPYADREFSIKNLDPNGVVELSCSHLNLNLRSPCLGDLMYVFNGEKIEELCGDKSGFKTTSKGTRMTIKITSGGKGGGAVRCVARAVAPKKTSLEELEEFLQFDSTPEDSREWGLGGAKKTTTCPCGKTNKGRIVGGKETKANEFPFMLGLINMDLMMLMCGASVLTPRHALTAAHCTYPRKQDKLGVIVGWHDVRQNLKIDWKKKNHTGVVAVERTIEHEQYDPKLYHNDIALLVLKESMDFNNNLSPVCFPSGPLQLTHQNVKVIGWGRMGSSMDTADFLMKVTLRVVPLPLCQDRFPGKVDAKLERQLCTYGHGKDSCSGDSGGPVIWVDPETNRYTLVGLVSFGKKICALKDNPAVNTNVDHYLDWIQTNIRRTSSGLQTCAKIG